MVLNRPLATIGHGPLYKTIAYRRRAAIGLALISSPGSGAYRATAGGAPVSNTTVTRTVSELSPDGHRSHAITAPRRNMPGENEQDEDRQNGSRHKEEEEKADNQD